MGVSNDLVKPETDEDFEAMCHALYRRMWNDTGCVRMGRSGQPQFGVDILGYDGQKVIGVQCKHYIKKPFTFSTVTDDIEKAEKADLYIEHLLFATSAPGKSTLVKQIHELSRQRRMDGKFTVSVDFWGELSGHIRLHPEIGRTYIPGFPGSTLLEINEKVNRNLVLYEVDRESNTHFQKTTLETQSIILELTRALQRQNDAPVARGDEADPGVVASLDFIRDRLREGKSRDALEVLKALGDPSQFKDQFSRFRWHTNHAAVALLEGRDKEAAIEYLTAFEIAPDEEKAQANRVLALLLLETPEEALVACDESLRNFPQSVPLWSLKLNARQMLNEPEPDRDLPERLRTTPDLLFVLANLKDKSGDYPAALELLRQCLSIDGDSFEAKRAYLANALGWAIHDSVLAHHGQLTKDQRDVLTDAIQRLEPLEQTLPSIQSDYISLELSSNATVSLMLLGKKDRAQVLAANLIARHPLSEGLLRVRLYDLDERNDVPGIHALTDLHLTQLPASIIGILAEISANRGDLAWHADIVAAAQASEREPHLLRELRIMSIHARWVAGDQLEAMDSIREYLREHPEHVGARVLLGQMLEHLGQKSEAIQEAEICVTHLLKAEASSLDILQVADLSFDLERFREAGSLYTHLVKVPANDRLTRRLLICLVESDQRRLARATLDQLVPSVRMLSPFRRIEANLSRRTGDWPRMRDLLAQELKQFPDDIAVALGYVAALHQLGDKDNLSVYLATDPHFKDSSPENEFEFSKYQSNYKIPELATARLYRLYRRHSGSTKAASFYLTHLLIAYRVRELERPTKAGAGVAVYLKSSKGTRVIAIDIEPTTYLSGWPELVSPDAQIAKNLQGLKLGDKVRLVESLDDQEVEVTALESLYFFVAQKAHQVVDAAAVPAGPLWSVRIRKNDGELDVEMFLKSTQQRKEHVRNTFGLYQKHRFPISMLATILDSDPVTLLLDWPFLEATLFVGIGTQEEREGAVKVLRQESKRFVIDLLTTAELVQRKSFEAVIKLLGRPLVPQSVRDHLLALMQLIDQARPSATLVEEDGRLQIIETPPEYFENRADFLCEMLHCIDELCDVVPTTGPNEITNTHTLLSKILDSDSLDALYLCVERNAILVSDDGALRLLAREAGVEMSIGVQPILMEACDKGFLSKEVYADALVSKLAAGHEFVSVRAAEMLTLAERSPANVHDGLRTAIMTFAKPTLDITSGVQVACEFLMLALERLPPVLTATYGMLILEMLQHERPELSDEIHRVIAHAVRQALQRQPRRMQTLFEKALAPLLAAPKVTAVSFRMTPIASFIQRLFRDKTSKNTL